MLICDKTDKTNANRLSLTPTAMHLFRPLWRSETSIGDPMYDTYAATQLEAGGRCPHFNIHRVHTINSTAQGAWPQGLPNYTTMP